MGPPRESEAGPLGKGTGRASWETSSTLNSSANGTRRQAEIAHHQDFADIDGCIEAAEDYERMLAIKQARLRRLILNLTVYRDNLLELGKAVWRNAA